MKSVLGDVYEWHNRGKILSFIYKRYDREHCLILHDISSKYQHLKDTFSDQKYNKLNSLRISRSKVKYFKRHYIYMHSIL